ncbi:uncharacterized protein LOC126366705 [Pectinophora gossypiella]|uniref:uncharacterized protein LOC126366705 n=1 Tax=Pectinophora gossypiella TaxID=13191 RepID=UPI00214E40D1|nr:uncharacterized protein LOC126366705 [Pectinophora gossypiella]
MLRFVTVFAVALVVALAAPSPTNVFKIDITPEEAQQYLNSLPFNEPKLSGRTAVLPLVRYDSPQFRAADAGPTLGHYWKNGQEIENTDDYVEEVYNAAQFHGQDGLGAYAYGYNAPESAKVENRARSGDVTGSYEYKSGNNDLIKVRYWADSQGFHQEDNLPKVVLEPVKESEDVRQARLAHEKAWQEAAAAAAQQPDPQGEYTPGKYEHQPSASEQQGVAVQAPGQNFHQQKQIQGEYIPSASEQQGVSVAAPEQDARQGKAYSSAQASFQAPQFGQQKAQYSQQSSQYSQSSASAFGQPAQGQYGQQQLQGKPEEPEPTGPPRGFFYSFDYPVSIIVRKDAQGQTGPVNPGQPIDHDTVGVSANPQRYG